MARTASLVAPAKRFAVNGRLAVGDGGHTVVWGLELTGEEIANTLTSGAYLDFVCTVCNDEAARCPELRPYVPAAMAAAAYDVEGAADELAGTQPAELEAPTVHGHNRHACPVCGHPMFSGGYSFDDTVSCGACSYREKRKPGKDYDACQSGRCTSRVPA